MDKTITLRVPATLDGAREASSSLRTFLDQFMLSPRAASRFELAVAEALNNVAEYSGSETGGMVEVTFTLDGRHAYPHRQRPGSKYRRGALNRRLEHPEVPDELSDGGRGSSDPEDHGPGGLLAGDRPQCPHHDRQGQGIWSMTMFHDNPLLRRGSGMSLSQRNPLYRDVLVVLRWYLELDLSSCPIIFFFTSIPPVTSDSSTFLIHILPFLPANELTFWSAHGTSPTRVGKLRTSAFSQ